MYGAAMQPSQRSRAGRVALPGRTAGSGDRVRLLRPVDPAPVRTGQFAEARAEQLLALGPVVSARVGKKAVRAAQAQPVSGVCEKQAFPALALTCRVDAQVREFGQSLRPGEAFGRRLVAAGLSTGGTRRRPWR
ncbi:hypothetical protein TPA0910_41530 [Streptomyces hygroscopicus subsp. sporocinereus]|uniref:Uncharacterized protein n=1 Tax=Streptomyces hygroscopicus TaxID=1912 RepID=A0ABQ3U290_STRHY|nr:hypothetical protein TPA0910_41530 [Streptomyces hygroscopicus]